jgi:hypothetical protein
VFAVLEFEVRVLCFRGRCSTAQATPPALVLLQIMNMAPMWTALNWNTGLTVSSATCPHVSLGVNVAYNADF